MEQSDRKYKQHLIHLVGKNLLILSAASEPKRSSLTRGGTRTRQETGNNHGRGHFPCNLGYSFSFIVQFKRPNSD